MQFLTNTKIDFMKYRRPMAVLSALLLIGGLVYVFALGELNIGIDFVGGTQVALDFREEQAVDDLRGILAEAGVPGARIQRYGSAEQSQFLIRTSTVEGSEEGSADDLFDALNAAYNDGAGNRVDLNWDGAGALSSRLATADPDGVGAAGGDVAAHYQGVAEAILGLRKQNGVIRSWEELAQVDGVSSEVVSSLQQDGNLGAFSLLSVENVGPQIGGELTTKGVWAVVLSLLGMLTYIAIRFELRFGIGAVAAIAHDVIISLGLYAFGGFEFNLTTIAAFLTLVGYSVNDTVVVFDRVRENMAKMRRKPLVEVMNFSLNQTLSRTLMTSLTTLLVVTPLFIYGGQVVQGFAFILMVGVVVGTYSSIFVASPVVLLWERWFGRKGKVGAAATAPSTS